MMNKNYLLIFGILLLVITPTLISSAPPQQIIQASLELESAYPTTHKLGEDYYIHTHVFNLATENLVTSGISCYYHFYNHQINGGQHISIGNLTQYGQGYEAIVNGSLINESGEYSALIWCNSSTEIGGNKYTFDVSPGGYDLTTPLALLLIGVLVIILTLLILTIRGMILVDDFGWNFGFLNIAYILLNIFFYTSWKVFSGFLIAIPTVGAALHTLWVISNIVWVPFILSQVAYILIKITEESQIKKLVKMGYTQDEATSRTKRRK